MSRAKLMLATCLGDGDEFDELVPDECFCAENHIAPSTARRWRQNSEGPEYLRIGAQHFLLPVANFAVGVPHGRSAAALTRSPPPDPCPIREPPRRGTQSGRRKSRRLLASGLQLAFPPDGCKQRTGSGWSLACLTLR